MNKKLVCILVIGFLIGVSISSMSSKQIENKIFSIIPPPIKYSEYDRIDIDNPIYNNAIKNEINIKSSVQKISISQEYNLVIITTQELHDAILSSNFIYWKELIGFNVKIINITDFEIISQTGNDLQEKIRNFLRNYYQIWVIKYVLFIGDHATIPMRYCYPDPTNHRFDPFDYTSGEVPTDYYYADLSESDSNSWDLDGDGFYGEYGEDNPDFKAEVYVGRIPTNNLIRITYTLNKTVNFEQDTGDWKNHALHAGAFFYFTNENNNGNPAMDGAVLSYYIEQNLMDGWLISHYSEQVGLEQSVYPWPALNEGSFINDWRNGQYALVNWQGHGWTNGVARKVWSWDDGDNIPEGNEITWPYFITMSSNLDDDYPSIVTAESCYVGCPEISPDGNLGIDLLTDPSLGAAIGVIASARSPYGSLDWPNNPGGSESILYEFNRFLINDSMKVGEALYNSKYYCNDNYGWLSYHEYIDMYTFNLFGDPSVSREGIYFQNINELFNEWNFLSPPFNQTIETSNIKVKYNDIYYRWSEATSEHNPTGLPIINNFIFGWNRIDQCYNIEDSLKPGYGCWMYSYQPCEIWTHYDSIHVDDYITVIEPSWNIISVPFTENVSKLELLVNGSSWSDAVSSGLVSDFIFGWDRAGQYYNFANILLPGYAYWIYAYQPCILKRTI